MKQLLTILPLVMCLTLFASDDAFDRGNTAYKNGNYEEAIEAYESVLEAGPDVSVYYNLGNAWYKSGEFAKGILYYEKALKLAPNDQDIQHNLSIAQLQVIDKIEPATEFFLLTWWKQLAGKVSANAWTIGFLIFLWVGLLSLLAFILTRGWVRRLLFFSGLSGIAICLVVLLLALTQFRHETREEAAIIMASSVSVKSEPLHSGTDLFIIHEGLKVNILDEEEGWLRISLADGKEGWISAKSLEVI